MRTHYTMWSKQDKIIALQLLARHVQRADNITYTRHCQLRMKRKGINKGMVRKTLTRGYLVEVHDTAGRLRFAYRYGKTIAVFEETNTGLLCITVWKNALNDHHATLDAKAYDCYLRDIAATYGL